MYVDVCIYVNGNTYAYKHIYICISVHQILFLVIFIVVLSTDFPKLVKTLVNLPLVMATGACILLEVRF